MHPILILLVGMAVILGAIIALRMNAFLALILAAIVVSLLAPGEPATKIVRVAEGFGRTAGNIGIVIALASIIGIAMTESGAADRIVRAFLSLLGEKRGGAALAATGWVLSIPVFFDTVFYLLVPLARSMYLSTGRHYLKYILAICAGGAATHTLVPPTPGPLAVAGTLGVDLGTMVLMGIAVSLPGTIMGLLYAGWVDRRMPIPMRAGLAGAAAGEPETPAAPVAPGELPALLPSILPIVLPVLLISANTVVASMTGPAQPAGTVWHAIKPWAAIVGNANFALLLSTAIAILVYVRMRSATRERVGAMVESSLGSAGIIILITAAGGAFGAALQAAQLGPAIQGFFQGQETGSGLLFLGLSFVVACLIKIAQGSSTVAMITTAGMLSAMISGAGTLPFHTVYIATAIASGSLMGTWMNDSGFWIISKMGGLTEVETLKSWTVLSAVVGTTAFVMTVVLALVFPMRGG